MSTKTAAPVKKTSTDLYQHPDHYLVDELLTGEQKLIRDTARKHVSKHLKPIFEESFEKAQFHPEIIPGLAEIGAFGPLVPTEYGGMGLDQIGYGLIMQEIERCDSGLRSLCSVQGSLVMYPIWKYGSTAAASTANSAEVARRSCSSAPRIPDTGISRACSHAGCSPATAMKPPVPNDGPDSSFFAAGDRWGKPEACPLPGHIRECPNL